MAKKSSLQKEVDSINKRLKKIDERLKELEKSSGGGTSAKELRKMNPSPPPEGDYNHNYLRRTINDAKRRYEQERKA